MCVCFCEKIFICIQRDVLIIKTKNIIVNNIIYYNIDILIIYNILLI